jgi:hypothetical protein
MFKKLARSIGKGYSDAQKFFQKGGQEIMFRKIKNTAKDLLPTAEAAGRMATSIAPALGPKAGAIAMGLGAAVPKLLKNVADTAADFQQASKKQKPNNDLERPAAAGGESQMFA